MASVTAADEKRVVDAAPKQLFIGGEWRDSASGKTLDIEDPSTEETICAVADGTPEDGYDFAGPEVFIGSADLMHRNLDRRVETLVRVADPEHVTELVDLIDLAMDDGTSSWHLQGDGEWERHTTAPDGTPLVDLQSVLVSRQRRRPGSAR